MDAKNAFLHDELDLGIYKKQPREFESRIYPSYNCKLKKVLNRLKQPPRACYEKTAEFLMRSGYQMVPYSILFN